MPTYAYHKNEIVGSFPGHQTCKVTSPGTSSVTVTFPQMAVIEGIMSLVILDSGNNFIANTADVTWTGNVVTIADGGSYTMANTDTIYLTVYGQRKR